MKAANASDRTPEFHKALAKRRSLGREQGIDWVVKKHNLDAIVLPANGYSVSSFSMSQCQDTDSPCVHSIILPQSPVILW